MKKITFEGKEYEVPDWVKWVARDKDGCINGYKSKPDEIIGDFFHSNEDFIAIYDHDLPWFESVTEV